MNRAEWAALTADERRAFGAQARQCVEEGCTEPAGTPWGAHWCADHDDERLDRICRQMAELWPNWWEQRLAEGHDV